LCSTHEGYECVQNFSWKKKKERMERIFWIPRSKWKDDEDDDDKLIVSID